MLILSRKIGESVYIGDAIVARVLGVKGKIIKLGFEAPKNVPIYREELFDLPKEKGRKYVKRHRD